MFDRQIIVNGIVASLLLLPAWAGADQFGDPRGFLVNEEVSESVLYPGVTLYRADGQEGGRPQVTHVVTVDLDREGLSLEALPGERFVNEDAGQFFRRSFVSQLQADNEVLAAINTAFFDIGSTQAPLGLLMEEGQLLREPGVPFDAFVFSEEGIPGIAQFGFSGEVEHTGLTGNLSGVNRPDLENSELVLYRQPWVRSPGTSAAFTQGMDVTEVLVEKTGFEQAGEPSGFSRLTGEVIEVRDNEESAPIEDDQFVISAAGLDRSFLLAMTPGAEVEVRWQLSGGPESIDWNEISEGVAGNNVLIIDGQRQSHGGTHWDDRHPRSAIGFDEDGTNIAILMVEGRQANRADGMSLHAVAAYLEHLGAYNALEFDGGGSSGLAARVDGEDRLVSTPSGSNERYVPAGLGVRVEPEEENPFFEEVRVTPGDDGAVISWETIEPAVSFVRFGRTGLDRESARNPEPRTRHSALLKDLESSRQHFARLIAETGDGEETSHLLSFVPGLEVVVPHPEAEFSGDDWRTGAFGTPWGDDYRWTETNESTIDHTATFQAEIPRAGIYDVYVWYVPGTNRTPNAQYEIHHTDGMTEAAIDQRSGASWWQLLGSDFHFDAGDGGYVFLHNVDGIGDNALMADAFRWVLRDPDPLPEKVLPDWWLTHFFGEEAAPGPDVDADGDGFSLWEEYIWATDPTDPSSRPLYRLEREADDEFQLIFSPFHENRTYHLYSVSRLGDEWEAVPVDPSSFGQTGEGMFEFSGDLPREFYRLEAREM